jgi:hypothetical protein
MGHPLDGLIVPIPGLRLIAGCHAFAALRR